MLQLWFHDELELAGHEGLRLSKLQLLFHGEMEFVLQTELSMTSYCQDPDQMKRPGAVHPAGFCFWVKATIAEEHRARGPRAVQSFGAQNRPQEIARADKGLGGPCRAPKGRDHARLKSALCQACKSGRRETVDSAKRSEQPLPHVSFWGPCKTPKGHL